MHRPSHPEGVIALEGRAVPRSWDFAMSHGEGTLIEHGTVKTYATLRKKQQRALRAGHTFIFEQIAGRVAYPEAA